MPIYEEKLIAALRQIQDKTSDQYLQNITDAHEADTARLIDDALLTILRERPAESLQTMLSLLNEVNPPADQTITDTNAQSGIGAEQSNDLWERLQQALLEQKNEFNARLTVVESKVQAMAATNQPADALADTKFKLEELSKQKEELQAKNQVLENEISKLYDTVTFATINRAEIATSNQPRVDELGRRFTSLYNQEVRDIQRTWDEFLTAHDPTWDSKEFSVHLKTSIRVALARAMTQYGMVIKAKHLSVGANELCQAIESLPTDHDVIKQARTLLLEQLDSILKASGSQTQPIFKSEQAAENNIHEAKDTAVRLIQDVLRKLGKDELTEKEIPSSVVESVQKTLETVREVIRQIYGTDGEVWLAEKATTFDAAIHERSKSSADDGLITETEWPGYRIGAKIIKPAIVITESQDKLEG